jgi:hypothetical protein
MLVPVARGLIEELIMDEGEERARALRLDNNGHERLAFRRRAPRPSEHNLLIGHYLTVNAAYVVLVAVGSTHDDVEAAAHARIRVGTQGLDLFRPELAL